MNQSKELSFVSRGGLKLEAALDAFNVGVKGMIVADFGSSTGGFVDVLLSRGAAKVYAVEKGYGVVDWKLRNDPRVVVMERTDATTVAMPEPLDLVTIDAGFARQNVLLPHALTLVKDAGVIISLLKPQYEASGHELEKGKLTENASARVVARVEAELKEMGIAIEKKSFSPILGKKAEAQEIFLLIRK